MMERRTKVENQLKMWSSIFKILYYSHDRSLFSHPMWTQLRASSHPQSYSFHMRTNTSRTWTWNHQQGVAIYLKAKIDSCSCSAPVRHRRSYVTKANHSTEQLKDDSISTPTKKKKGTVVGAVALIVGTSIGSGILALPKKTSPAGFIPSATSMVLCWGFLLIEALLLTEINVNTRRRMKKREEEDKLEIISIRTMAQETLGTWGGNLATINYIFLAYTSMVAYTSKAGEILSRVTNLPASLSGILFTIIFTTLISFGGPRFTDQINQWLTASMIGLLVAIEVIGASSGGWSELTSISNWDKVPGTVPVIIFSLVFHDLVPVICSYLGGDLARIRVSVVVGSLLPLIALIVWDAVALGLSPLADGIDPINMLMRVNWSGMATMVQAFSLLAVGTSQIGTLLGFSQFFLEQLNFLTSRSTSKQMKEVERKQRALFGLKDWWGENKSSLTAMAMAVAPPLLVSTSVPDAFSTATDIAGGYCMAMLYGVLPPAMAWAMHGKSYDDGGGGGGGGGEITLYKVKPALTGVGLFACGILLEQLLQDLSFLHL